MPMRGLAAVAAVLVSLAGVLASLACGSDEPGPGPAAATPAPEATATASPEPTPSATEVVATTTEAPAETTPRPTATAVASAATPDEDEATLAAELTAVALAPVLEEFGESAQDLTAHAFPVGADDERGRLWAVVTNGPQPFHVNDEGDVVNFFHFVALYRRDADATWSETLYQLTLETAPQRTEVEVYDTGPRRAKGPAPLIAIRGGTGAHAGTLDVVLVEGELLRTGISHVSARPGAGDIADLDGDGVVELIVNSSNPYVFCYACSVEEKGELVYRWDGLDYAEVPLEAPEGLESNLAEAADRVVRLAGANLWRDAALLAVETSQREPDHEGLRLLSIVVNRNAALRLGYAGSPGQPLLTHVFAGEYGAAFALMAALRPEEAFALDGPLIRGTAAEGDLESMVAFLLFYADETLKVRNDDPAIHAVRALGQVLASPDDLARARSSIARALRLAPDDAFLQGAQALLESIEVAPGAPEAAR